MKDEIASYIKYVGISLFSKGIFFYLLPSSMMRLTYVDDKTFKYQIISFIGLLISNFIIHFAFNNRYKTNVFLEIPCQKTLALIKDYFYGTGIGIIFYSLICVLCAGRVLTYFFKIRYLNRDQFGILVLSGLFAVSIFSQSYLFSDSILDSIHSLFRIEYFYIFVISIASRFLMNKIKKNISNFIVQLVAG